MPLITDDKNVVEGFIRRRRILEKILVNILSEKSPMAKRFAEKTAKTTGLSIEEVKKSEPYRNYIKRLFGT